MINFKWRYSPIIHASIIEGLNMIYATYPANLTNAIQFTLDAQPLLRRLGTNVEIQLETALLLEFCTPGRRSVWPRLA